MENKPPLQNAIDALEKLSTPEKIKLAEAIGHSIPEEFSAWMEKKVDELSETDDDDIRLAEEALAEYHANPESAVDGDLFLKQLNEKRNKVFEKEDEDIRLAEEALAEYHANPESAVPWETFYKEQKKKLKDLKTHAEH
jgi:hypothetical protein